MSNPSAPFHVEEFTASETTILERYFSNTDQPVFAIRGLPEVVKGALFARYSRSPKSVRRLFLDEFTTGSDDAVAAIADQATDDGPVGVERAQTLYDRVFTEYGDDSVAQLGGAHLAVEQASNILTKVLEWGRLASYLEQSTRYIFYDQKLGDRYRYHVPTELGTTPARERYMREIDGLFGVYSLVVEKLVAYYEAMYPKEDGDSTFVWRSTIRAKACDDARGLLPAATTSNVGIFASGQAYEALLLRMAAHPLDEVRWFGDRMLKELRTVIPSFMKRVDVPERGGVWAKYFTDNNAAMSERAKLLDTVPATNPGVDLVEWDPEGERRVAASALYPFVSLSDRELSAHVDAMSEDEIDGVFAAYVGNRSNRRHKPGRGLEETFYRFDIVCDYGIFRDLQRHRMLTLQWQALSPTNGFIVPESIEDVGAAAKWVATMERMALLYGDLEDEISPQVAQYVIPFAYNVRFSLKLNAREAFHMLELRTQQGGHPGYRAVCQEMHRQIRDVAGHGRIAEAMSFVDHNDYDLARLATERRAAARRAALGVDDPSA
ncbi:Thymidylate synthase ThyX [hydrothermal vent metagenome]|uniref:Thymidylate synthase ThyX n=1 Tax=hydrothermal vent metagenome TaxID=652676 RepID=A0A3B0SRW3_9ZZZZ